jgi:hypothetical protein
LTVRNDRVVSYVDVCDIKVSLPHSYLNVDRVGIYIRYLGRPVAVAYDSISSIHRTDLIETDYRSIEALFDRYLGVSVLESPVDLKGLRLVPHHRDGVQLEDDKGKVLTAGALRAPSYFGAFMNVRAFLEGQRDLVRVMADWSLGLSVARIGGRYFVYKGDKSRRERYRYFETYPYVLRDLLALGGEGGRHRHYILFRNGSIYFSGEGADKAQFREEVSRIFPRGLKMLKRFGHLSRPQASAELKPQDMREYSCSWG